MGKAKIAIEPDSGAPWQPVAAAPGDWVALAAQFIPAGARVLDLGCRATALRKILPHGCAYIGCDAVSHDSNTLVCDLDRGDFPADTAVGIDVIVMLGLLDRVPDADALFAHLRRANCTVVLSIQPADFAADTSSAGSNRRYGLYDLTRLFDRHGFRIECSVSAGQGMMLIRLAPEQRIVPVASYRVAAVSGGMEFSERVGRQLVASVLPGETAITHLTFDSLDTVRDEFDLVVIGAGGGLLPVHFNDALFDVISRGRAAIGIFGTLYRELVPRVAMERLLGSLDIWYARHEADVLMYGRGRDNVSHLGDWIIDAFPMAAGSEDEPLLIGGNVGADSDLARTIAHIQRHKRVFSAQPAGLLCALTAAETAAYSEPQNGRLPGLESGEFRGLLIDVFGRSFPEKDYFLIDRDAVLRYRARVHAHIIAMRERIGGLLQAKRPAA